MVSGADACQPPEFSLHQNQGFIAHLLYAIAHSHFVLFGGGRGRDPVLLTLGRLQRMPQTGKNKDSDAIWIS